MAALLDVVDNAEEAPEDIQPPECWPAFHSLQYRLLKHADLPIVKNNPVQRVTSMQSRHRIVRQQSQLSIAHPLDTITIVLKQTMLVQKKT